eukprot:106203_1
MSGRKGRKRKAEEASSDEIKPPSKKQKESSNDSVSICKSNTNCWSNLNVFNISATDSYFFILSTYFHEQIHPLTVDICKHISEYCSSKDTKNYIVIIRILSACYDIWCTIKHKLLLNTTKEKAIKIGKQLYFNEINKAFRGGVENCSDKQFELKDIETYNMEYYAAIWEGSDPNGQQYASPGGPCILQIYEYTHNSQENKEIYHLPSDGNFDFEDDSEEENEDDQQEEDE